MNVSLPRFLFVFLVLSQVVAGDVGEALVQKSTSRYSIPGTFHNLPAAVAVDPSGDLYVASFVEVTFGKYRAGIAKLDGTTGLLRWQWQSTFQLADSYSDRAVVQGICRLAVRPDGNPVALFYSAVVKLASADGTILWSVTSPYSPDQYNPGGFSEVAFDSSGAVLVAGADSGGRGGKVWKFDRESGRRLWDRLVNGTVALEAMKTDAGGNICVAGSTSLAVGSQKTCAAKLSPDGVILWSRTEANSAESGRARLLTLDPAGDLIVATYPGRLLKYRNSDGVRQWSVAALTNPKDLLADAAGDIYLINGEGTYPNRGSSYIARYAGETGVRAWQSSGDSYTTHKVSLLMRGDQLLVYGSSYYSGLVLAGIDRQTGATRWYQQYISPFPTYYKPVATTGTRAVTLMALQPDGDVVVAGAAPRSWNADFESIVVKYGSGPSVGNPGTVWVLPTRAQLRATAVGNFSPSEIFWEYGLTTDYGSATARQPIVEAWMLMLNAPTYRVTIEGLAENTLYHARAVAVSARGTSVSADFTFTTGWDANGDKLPDEWELEKWGSTSWRSIEGDEDQDGTGNLLEYSLDRHPRVSDAAATPVPTIDADGHLAMTVTKRPHVTLEVEASTDLVSWVRAVIVREGAASFTAREEFPPKTPGGRFLRVRATTEY